MNIPHQNKHQAGFTIVELLIVIVVIGILAAITVVAYNGIQRRAQISSLSSALSQAAKKVAVHQADQGSYPASLGEAGVTNSDTISYSYSQTSGNYCITALYNNALPYNITQSTGPRSGPCDGQSGGVAYCPSDSHVAINGYYCDGTEGSPASLNSNAIKLSKTASGVPPNAPSEYVGRQSTRDNYLSSSFPVSTGDIYCVEGWVATTDSTVTHAIGLQLAGPSVPNTWVSGAASTGYASTSPVANWTKISGCIGPISSNYNVARMWSQNNGTNGSTADAFWYQTAIKLTKQS